MKKNNVYLIKFRLTFCPLVVKSGTNAPNATMSEKITPTNFSPLFASPARLAASALFVTWRYFQNETRLVTFVGEYGACLPRHLKARYLKSAILHLMSAWRHCLMLSILCFVWKVLRSWIWEIISLRLATIIVPLLRWKVTISMIISPFLRRFRCEY